MCAETNEQETDSKKDNHVVDYKNAVTGLLILVILNGILISLAFNKFTHLYISAVGLGVLNFYGMMILSNYLSGTNPLDTGEFRQAITASFVLTYISIVLFSILPGSKVVLTGNQSFATFSQLTILIVTYYFGSKVIENWVGNK